MELQNALATIARFGFDTALTNADSVVSTASIAPTLLDSAKAFASEHPVAAAAVGGMALVGGTWMLYSLYRKVTAPTPVQVVGVPQASPLATAAPANTVAAPAASVA